VTLVSFPEGSAVILKSVSGSVGYLEVKHFVLCEFWLRMIIR
jgi:hypothetical protein